MQTSTTVSSVLNAQRSHQVRHRAAWHCWRVVSRCSCSFLHSLSDPFPFPEVLPENRVLRQETLSLRRQENQQIPEMRSRAGGNPSQGCQSVRTPCLSSSPPKVTPPLGIPQIVYFLSRFPERLKQPSGLPRWTLGGPLGVPMVPPGCQRAFKMAQNGHQNMSQKASRTQNTECEQTILFAMF